MAKSDPYVKVKFSNLRNASYRTKFVRKELNPVWNTSFREEGPSLFERVREIHFEVHDRDRFSKDDLMGSCTVRTMESPQAFYASPMQWIPLVDGDGKVVQNKNGEDAALQISIRYAPKMKRLSIHHWTHVMELTIIVKFE